MSPVAINGVDKQGVAVNGVQVKQALAAASEVVAKGVYDPTTLSAVDADLAVANIKDAVTIFGKLGTFAGADPTITRLALVEAVSCGTSWTEVLSVTVPAAAKTVIIITVGGTGSATGRDNGLRGLYNGVQRFITEWNGASGSPRRRDWFGDTIGSDAIAKVDHYSESGCNCWGATIWEGR